MLFKLTVLIVNLHYFKKDLVNFIQKIFLTKKYHKNIDIKISG